MTCIVGYLDKVNKTMYIGGDSLGYDPSTYSTYERTDPKVFINGKMLIGFTESFRMGQLLHWKLKLPTHPKKMSTDEYMYTIFIDAIIKLFTENGYSKIESNQNSGGTFLTLYQGNIYRIDSDYQIGKPLECFESCGSGESATNSVISVLEEINPELSPKIKIEKAISHASKYTAAFNNRIEILSMDY